MAGAGFDTFSFLLRVRRKNRIARKCLDMPGDNLSMWDFRVNNFGIIILENNNAFIKVMEQLKKKNPD